jgi:hypothetical protein
MNPELSDVPGFAASYINKLRQQFQQKLQLAFEQQQIQLRDGVSEKFSL